MSLVSIQGRDEGNSYSIFNVSNAEVKPVTGSRRASLLGSLAVLSLLDLEPLDLQSNALLSTQAALAEPSISRLLGYQVVNKKQKGILMRAFWLAFLFSFSAWAVASDDSAQQELSQRLALNDGFSAQFTQTIVAPDGEMIGERNGKLDIARPSLFRMSFDFPEEGLMVSDGATLWIFDPDLEQVSIFDQQEAIAQTPLALLTQNRAQDWEQYYVSKEKGRYVLSPRAVDSVQGKFVIDIDTKGAVKGFEMIEQDGQISRYAFNNVELGRSKSASFSFTVPEGVDIDDQRN